jgi:hypothetical protein
MNLGIPAWLVKGTLKLDGLHQFQTFVTILMGSSCHWVTEQKIFFAYAIFALTTTSPREV